MSGSNGGFNNNNRALDAEQITDALRRHDEGESWTDLAAEFDVTPSALIYHHHKANGTTSQPRVAPATVTDEEPEDVPAIAAWQPPGPWADDALCAQTDPESFFPEKGGSTREGKEVCRSCLVRAECLDYALANNERFGIWGGLSERERRHLAKNTASAPTHGAHTTPAA